MAMSPEERRLKHQEWSRAWRKKNPEKYLEQARKSAHKRRAANPGLAAAECRRYREKNSAKIEAQRRQRWANDHEFRAESNRARLARYRLDPEKANAERAANYERRKEDYPWETLLRAAKQRAFKKNLPFALTADWARARWTGCCEVSGIPFILRFPGVPGPKIFSASLDQITAKGGYTPDNCRFVIWGVNALKHDGTDDEMIRIAHAIAGKNPMNSTP